MKNHRDKLSVPGSRDSIVRIGIAVRGRVQGVGFRPYVYRLASSLGLAGWVGNSPAGVDIELEGRRAVLEQFLNKCKTNPPPLARIDNVSLEEQSPKGDSGFQVRTSGNGSDTRSALITPDMATCGTCRDEILDTANRRYRYPFTNCTDCGPRFSIINALPYDRANTTMNIFPMCPECRAEYEDPGDRRFHAQPNACPRCGPHLELWDDAGRVLARHDEALVQACRLVLRGGILALKGLGGFQLVVDAQNDGAVRRLRRLKARQEKPFALMFPDLHHLRLHCDLAPEEQDLLTSPAAPILLARCTAAAHRIPTAISPAVAPGNPYWGVMLPYTPLHHLLMAELGSPVVATSGNVADEPICIDEQEALVRLRGIADVFLVHNRPIARQMDDSVVQFVDGEEMVLRNARGYAPMSIRLPRPGPTALALGAHVKNAVAVSAGRNVFVSQHIGDLSTSKAREVFARELGALPSIYHIDPQQVISDLHPDYHSTVVAGNQRRPLLQVQHHIAHVFSCMAEHGLAPPVLGIAWDGTGLGDDGTIWGGEFFKVDGTGTTRFAHMRSFPLPGSEQAIVDPCRSALGVLYEIFGDEVFSQKDLIPLQSFRHEELEILRRMLKQKLNTPRTSSVGRLFDAVAAITGICRRSRFEGQAAMKVQFAAETDDTTDAYPFQLSEDNSPLVLDWQPMVISMLNDVRHAVGTEQIAAQFHRTLVAMLLAVARRSKITQVVLSGGCFQNKVLTRQSMHALRLAGLNPFCPQRVPPNDGGIALGQIYRTTITMNEEN
jgi:hydrogenase maturation protein HypF